ncbi:MAG: thiolase domain-containing protein [Candidatus Thorarchaeota archaeon]|nr:thiolase domain-containing protein [Candidatus Thorarchaeota archaeon]
MKPVYVIGVGMTRFGRLEESIVELARQAAVEALRDAGAVDVRPDRLVVGSQNPDEFTGIGHLSTLLADQLGLVPAGATRVETGPSAGSSAYETGVALVGSGLSELVLVIGVEKMSDVDRGTASKILAKMMSQSNETLYGGTPAALAALVARRYMHDYGLTREDLALLPVKAHRNGAKNPLAHFQKEITVEKVLASPVVADPLTLYDCCPTSDGAAAVVLASKETMRELVPEDHAMRILGIGHATDYLAVQHRLHVTSLNATIEAANLAFSMAGLTPNDVDVWELHDAFSILELINMEDIGLAERGRAIEMIREGATEVDGCCPVNTTGGLKARGHPTGATGIAQIHDLVLQLRGDAPPALQVSEPEIGVSHNIGGFGNNMVVSIIGTV